MIDARFFDKLVSTYFAAYRVTLCSVLHPRKRLLGKFGGTIDLSGGYR